MTNFDRLCILIAGMCGLYFMPHLVAELAR